MNKDKNKNVFFITIIALIAITIFFHPAFLQMLPDGIREGVESFEAMYFSKTIAANITLEAIGAVVLTLAVTWMVAYAARYLIDCLKFSKHRSETLRVLFGKILYYAIWIVGIIVALGCLGVDTNAIFVSAGVVGIIVGFGAQSLIEDVITGLFIILEGEFGIGDIITIDGFRGEVKSIGLRTVSIIDLGGNIRIINNSDISSLVNLSEVTSVAVITVPVSYADPLSASEDAIKEALSELPSEYPDIFKEPPIYKGVENMGEECMELMVVAKVAEENIYNARRIMLREIRYSFEKAELTALGGE